MVLLLIAFIRVGFEGSLSNTRVFIYDTDTTLLFNRRAVFVSYINNLNFFTVSVGKNYRSIVYNYERGMFSTYGSFIKDSSVSITNFYASIKPAPPFLEFFYEVDGQYDTILKGGRFIGISTRLTWPEKGIEFIYSGKYGLDAKESMFSFNLSSINPLLSLTISATFQKESQIPSTWITYNVPLHNDIYLENSLNLFGRNIRLQSLAGINEVKSGPFLEVDSNIGYNLSGIATNILAAGKIINVTFTSYGGYKRYTDTFFNSNTPYLQANGNITLTSHGISFGVTGSIILEKETKSFYIISYIAKEF